MERLDLSAAYRPIELSIHLARYACARPLVEGKHVLDLACGEGYGSHLLKRWGAATVTGVDVAEEAVRKAATTFRDEGLSFICASFEEVPAKVVKPFDVIVCIETLEHVENADELLRTLKQLAHQETAYVISCPNDTYYYGRGFPLNQHHKRSYSFYDFRSLTQAHLGEARWYFGTSLNGFGCFEIQAPAERKTYVEPIASVTDGFAHTLPNYGQNSRLKPSSCLFYVGIWPDTAVDKTSFQAAFPARADFRMPGFSNVSPGLRAGQRRRLAFVIDTRSWAFDNIVDNIVPYLEGRYSIQRFYVDDYKSKADLFAAVFVENTFDNVHFMWRETLFKLFRKDYEIEALRVSSRTRPKALAKALAAPVITTSVYDHLHADKAALDARRGAFGFVDGYATASYLLYDHYTEALGRKPTAITPDGVNQELFRPLHMDRFADEDRPLVVGWAGNSKWGQLSAGGDPKGLHSVILPAIADLQSKGMRIRGHFADRHVEWRPRDAMPEYYSEIDVLVCASEHEGTPNPVLEAMACGVPVVSTDVGIVAKVFGAKQKRFILAERTSEGLAQSLSALYEDRSLLRELSAENIAAVRDWTWRAQVPKWLALFRNAEESHSRTKLVKEFAWKQAIRAGSAGEAGREALTGKKHDANRMDSGIGEGAGQAGQASPSGNNELSEVDADQGAQPVDPRMKRIAALKSSLDATRRALRAKNARLEEVERALAECKNANLEDKARSDNGAFSWQAAVRRMIPSRDKGR